MAALLCVLGPFSIPIGPIPVSLGTFAVSLCAMILGGPLGALSVLIYLLLGASGLPVFTGFQGGLAKIAGPTGGYMAGYLLHAFVGGMLVKRFRFKVIPSFLALTASLLLDYVLGSAWFMFSTGAALPHTLKVCVLPFIPFDLLKNIGAVWLGLVLRKQLRQD